MIAATVVGSLGRDAELKTIGNTSVLSFALASERKVKGEKSTIWVSCSLWSSRGETLARYLTKGSKVSGYRRAIDAGVYEDRQDLPGGASRPARASGRRQSCGEAGVCSAAATGRQQVV